MHLVCEQPIACESEVQQGLEMSLEILMQVQIQSPSDPVMMHISADTLLLQGS